MAESTRNHPPPLDGFDPLACDPALVEAVHREGAGDALPTLKGLGEVVASGEGREHARLADAHPPVLRGEDGGEDGDDEIAFHPSWHWLVGTSVGWGLHATPWVAPPGSGAHVARAAGFYLMHQLDAAHCCPISATYAAVPALRLDAGVADRFEPGLRAQHYAPGTAEPGGKAGLLAGLSLTERGGSDLRTVTAQAEPLGDGAYRVTGHKWWTSAPAADLLVVLAQAPGGPTCVVVPRVRADGRRNAVRVHRLHDKLGNRANATAEVEYAGAVGRGLGEEGQGIAAALASTALVRLDGVLGSAALVRSALSEAAHHVAHRRVSGGSLAATPLMRTVVADLALESEAATALALRLAGAVDREEHGFLRLALPAAKYLVCRRAPAVVAEALECLGGAGYDEDSGLPRLYREAPLHSLDDGGGNVAALDVLQAVGHEPESAEAVLAEIDEAAGIDSWFDRGVRELRTELRGREERRARRLAELLALCLQGSLLLRYAPDDVASAFVSSRFLPDGPWRTMGTLPAEAHTESLVERVTPSP